MAEKNRRTTAGGRPFRPGQSGNPAGRPKGPNKATRDVKIAAQAFTTQAVRVLADIMLHGESEQARIAAAKELLDRGHGKAPQALTDADGGPLVPATVIHEHILGSQ